MPRNVNIVLMEIAVDVELTESSGTGKIRQKNAK
jgi:hypothetical protein